MKLKDLRITKGLTQSEVSEILEIPLRTYKRLENDTHYLGSLKYKQIYDLLLKIPAKGDDLLNKSNDIVVIGLGYVGLSLAALLSIHNRVIALDIDKNRVNSVNNRQLYFKDQYLEKLFKERELDLTAMLVNENALKKVDFVIIATNTDFDQNTNSFDLESVVSSIKLTRKVNKNCLIVIKSTVPMGFTKSLDDKNIIFSPEFLREGTAVYDNLHPSRIIIGADTISPKVKEFAKCLANVSRDNIKPLFMSSQEAEAVKLFSNAYLAMRVAYFNELDTYAETNNLDTKNIVKGVSMDPRIGDYYNNPSFGYGGYCLPKDTAQLKGSFVDINNNNLIEAIVESNETRKEYIALQIINKVDKDSIVGVYKLSMKKNSDNYRNASILDIIDILIREGYKIIIYDPSYNGDYKVDTLEEFKKQSTIIVANRFEKELEDVVNKVYTRDLL